MGLWLAALSGIIAGGGAPRRLGGRMVRGDPEAHRRRDHGRGAGVLISTLAYELVEEAADDGGLVPTVAGFLGGAILYRRGLARHPAEKDRIERRR